MYNRLTKALLGPVDLSESECNRITQLLLTDSFLYNTVMESLIAERGPEILNTLHPLQRQQLIKKVKYVAPPARIRIEWSFIPETATLSGRNAQIRARRFYGDAKTHEEQMFWRPMNEVELGNIREPWTNSVPPPEVISQYANWLHAPDAQTFSLLKEQALGEAEAVAKKQAQQLPGELGAAVNVQKASHPGEFGKNEEGPRR
jgi:hypothetical protein